MTNVPICRKPYRMQFVGKSDNTIRTTIPRFLIEREAKKHSLTPAEFLDNFKIVWNMGEGALSVEFERID
jgi:hypothetical protein